MDEIKKGQTTMDYLNNKLYREELESLFSTLSIDELKGKSLLITGATGLIGSYLVDLLVLFNKTNQNKINIYAMGRNKEKLEKRFSSALNSKEMNIIVHDMINPLPTAIEFDYIIHAASNADPKSYSLYPVETITTNVIGTYNILEYAKKFNSTRVLFTSTMEVYGESNSIDSFKEQDFGLVNFNEIRASYPESKRIAELMCKSYGEQYNLNCVIVRLGYIYGPTMAEDDSKVIAQFMRNVFNGEDILLKSKGQQKRSYCYVADTVVGILHVLLNGEQGESYNVSNTQEIITIYEIALLLSKLTKTNISFDFDENQKNIKKPMDAVINNQKLLELGWKIRYDMENGLKKTLSILNYELKEENF